MYGILCYIFLFYLFLIIKLGFILIEYDFFYLFIFSLSLYLKIVDFFYLIKNLSLHHPYQVIRSNVLQSLGNMIEGGGILQALKDGKSYEMLFTGHDNVIEMRNTWQLWASTRVIWKNGISSNERRKGKERIMGGKYDQNMLCTCTKMTTNQPAPV